MNDGGCARDHPYLNNPTVCVIIKYVNFDH
jgi:hypothetical protein